MAKQFVRVREIMIVANTPQLQERGILWFARNMRRIRRAALLNPFWKHNSTVVREHKIMKLSALAGSFISLGYERVENAENAGAFAIRGGALHIAPINTKEIYSIEFTHNTISAIWKGQKEIGKKLTKNKRSIVLFLRDGDYVVHKDHGIGIWRGVMEKRGKQYFLIHYAAPKKRGEPDALLVPLEKEDKIIPYTGFRAPTVHRLGTPIWKHALKKTKHDARRFAIELLALMAERAVQTRRPYSIDYRAEEQLRCAFGHDITQAQKRALKEVFSDLSGSRPMDRLLLGDVGFGKTEVAISAALQAALNGKQTAVLVPTTILAEQHAEIFKKRLAPFPIIVERISRLLPQSIVRRNIQKLKNGTADIVIGTHRLLSKDIRFKNLGLLIIDEEQRFGVKAKEQLKQYKKSANFMETDGTDTNGSMHSINTESHYGTDVLSLSATPLPRTLHLALTSIKHISIIDEPPKGRITPTTIVRPYCEDIAKEAVTRELSRGGQVYFLANRIRTIPGLLQSLQALFPKTRFGILHGRLQEAAIARTMREFRDGIINVLISTTIIENGIDLRNANTLLVHDATRLGLAEAHQLRGRIGRGNTRAYAYFCYPPRLGITLKTKADARYAQKQSISSATSPALERLSILLDTQYLGAGETIARHDLEMRGAGNILGREQSGAIHRVGMNLYCQMLAEAVEQLKNAPNPCRLGHTKTTNYH